MILDENAAHETLIRVFAYIETIYSEQALSPQDLSFFIYVAGTRTSSVHSAQTLCNI